MMDPDPVEDSVSHPSVVDHLAAPTEPAPTVAHPAEGTLAPLGQAEEIYPSPEPHEGSISGPRKNMRRHDGQMWLWFFWSSSPPQIGHIRSMTFAASAWVKIHFLPFNSSYTVAFLPIGFQHGYLLGSLYPLADWIGPERRGNVPASPAVELALPKLADGTPTRTGVIRRTVGRGAVAGTAH